MTNSRVGNPFGYRRVIELSHPLVEGIPNAPVHEPYRYRMTRSHDWRPDRESPFTGTADAISTGTHVGTHIDSIYHVACQNCLHHGHVIGDQGVEQTHERGLNIKGRANFTPIVAPGLLLDFPNYLGTSICRRDYEIGPKEIKNCLDSTGLSIEPGDVILIRTGFDRLYEAEANSFLLSPQPGINTAAAVFLRDCGIAAIGADNIACEKIPLLDPLAPHAALLIEGGIPIIECMALAELSAAARGKFMFVCAPLRMTGATGSPVNPIALIADQ